MMDAKARENMRFEHVQRFLNSGMKVAEWCNLNGIAQSTLYSWMAKYRKTEFDGELDARQKSKATTEWIELTRKELVNESALAIVSDTHTEHLELPSVPGQTSLYSRQNIGISLNGAHISIAPGTDRRDIETVLQAVSLL